MRGKLKVENGKWKVESGKRKTNNAEGYQCYPYDQHCSEFVGEGLAPPETYVKMTLICGAYTCFRRDVPQPETAPLCRYATPPLRGDHIGHPSMTGVSAIEYVR